MGRGGDGGSLLWSLVALTCLAFSPRFNASRRFPARTVTAGERAISVTGARKFWNRALVLS